MKDADPFTDDPTDKRGGGGPVGIMINAKRHGMGGKTCK